MTSRELEEYTALRDTIRERGTARHWIVVVGLGLWAGLTVAVAALLAVPVGTLIPLLVLATVFEVVFALHTAVERVGRYLQVFHEQPGDVAAWEQVAMRYGRSFGGGGIDALFSPIFWVAALLNFIPAVVSGPLALDSGVAALVHVLFMLRVWVAKRQAAVQRAVDLERFAKLKDESRS
jgi:xanthine/uracil permease